MNADERTSDYSERYAAYWRRLCAAPQRYDLFGTLRWIEALGAPYARIGRATYPRDEPLRLGQVPSLAFAPTMVACVAGGQNGAAPPRLLIHGFGLFGPNGPMPLHLTEYAHATANDAGANGLSAFSDLFHHRAIALFYRAWADAQPVVSRDRAASGPFDRYVASLIGRAQRTQRQHASTLPTRALCFYAGHWVRHTRNPEGLVRMLTHEFGVPVRLVEHVAQWLSIEESQRTTLRTARPEQRLGNGAVLGRAVRDGQSLFRLVLGPMPLERYRTFLPNGSNAKRIAQWVREYVGVELGWAMQIKLASDQIPCYSLGGREGLGHSVWLGCRSKSAPAHDLTIDWTARSARAKSEDRAGTRAAASVATQSQNE